MANPWDGDPVVSSGGNPWDSDPVVSTAKPSAAKNQRPSFANVRSRASTAAAGQRPARRDMSPAALTGISDEQMQPEGYLSHLGRGAAEFGRAAGHNAMGFVHGTADALGEGTAQGFEVAESIAPGIFGPSAQVSRQTANSDQAATKAREAQYQQDVPNTPASYAGAATGQVLPWMVGAPAKLLTAVGVRGPGLLAKMAGGARQGAVVGAASPVTGEGSYVSQKAGQIGVGALVGSGGQVVGDALVASGARAAKAVTPELRNLYGKAQAMGIQLTPAQITDSGFIRRLGLMTDNLPFSGATARRAAQQEGGNRATAAAMGETSDTVNRTTMANAYKRLGSEFDSHFSGGMRYDRKFLREVATIKKDATIGMDPTATNVANRFADRISRQGKNGNMSGKTLQSLDQEMRKWATGGGDRQQVATSLRSSLHDAYERQSSTAAREAWRTTRQQYAILKDLEPLVASNPEGGIPIQQLQQRINSDGAGKAARSRGNDGPLGPIADVGQRMKSPNTSGTAENTQAAGVGWGMFLNPLLTAATIGTGGLASRLMSSKAASNYVLRQGIGNTRNAVGQSLKAQVMTPAAVRAKREQDKKKTK